MLQDNPLLVQLKQKLHSQTPRVEGVVKGTDKKFGFLEVDSQKSYFIPPPQMKKVMHGDRIIAVLQTEKERQFAEPETLVAPFLTRFVGRVQKKDERLLIVPDHPLLKEAIPCRPVSNISQKFQQGDWAVAEMRRHPLKGNHSFYAELTEFITTADNPFAPWTITLSRHNLEKKAPTLSTPITMDEEQLERNDLTALTFITIDSASTQDIDDALYVEETPEGALQLTIAIADPTAYVSAGSELDNIAAQHGYTIYLPGLDIPMLPRQLSDDICSLHPKKQRPVLACRVTVATDGTLSDDIHFFAAWIESKSKLIYDNVSDWLENKGGWQPESENIEQQLRLLHRLCLARIAWREKHALVFKERPDYRFLLGEKGEVLDIIVEHRRIANRMVEEAMVAANICAATVLREKLSFGFFNVHAGFDSNNAEQAAAILSANGMNVDPASMLTLEGFCTLRRELDSESNAFLSSRIRRFQAFGEISLVPSAHFGLGLPVYATWTSPIRKYSDMVNHRLLKAIIKGETPCPPLEALTITLTERRRLNRMAERDVTDWLYAHFLQKSVNDETRFSAEIIDISRGGMRVRLRDNGAMAFIPASFLHAVRDEIVCSQESGMVQIKGQAMYQVTDVIDVIISEVRLDTRSIVARPLL